MREDYNVTILFETGLGGNQQYRYITKWFNGMRHMSNYMNFMRRNHKWMVDEVFINEGYPFKEGETYYTIEDGRVVESCWDDVSEEMYDKRTHYFDTARSAMIHLETFS